MTLINGAHCIIYSTDADVGRAVLRDALDLPNVDVGGGWLIFGLPPAELAVHPAEANNTHELYLMCDQLDDVMTEPTNAGVACNPVDEQGRDRLTRFALPGGGKVGVCQAAHARPPAVQ